MPGKHRIIVKRDNPGLEIDVTDQVLQMFKDVAGLQTSVALLWKVVLGGMTGGFGLITALIVIL